MYRTEAEFEALCAGMPEAMAEMARQVPSTTCWRIRDEPGHYTVLGYSLMRDDTLTVKLIHGADSHAPGFGVLGVKAADLIRCDCGEWQEPTEEQADETEAKIAAIRRLLHNNGRIRHRGPTRLPPASRRRRGRR